MREYSSFCTNLEMIFYNSLIRTFNQIIPKTRKQDSYKKPLTELDFRTPDAPTTNCLGRALKTLFYK